MSTLAQAIKTTTKAFVQSYVEASKTKDMSTLSRALTDDCRITFGPPQFLAGQGAPPDFSMSSTEYAGNFHGMTLYHFDRHVIHNLVVDAPNLKACARTELFITLYSGEEATRNFVFFLDFVEDGGRICKVYEYVDTEEENDWLKRIKDIKAAKGQQA